MIMRLFSLFQSNALSPAWSYTSPTTIWRLMLSGDGKIIGESRNADAKRLSYFCVDDRTGKTLWEGKNFGEDWWMGMEAVHGGVLLLHGFAKPDMPQHQRMTAVDVETGEILWSNAELTYWFGFHERVYAYRDLFEKRIGVSLNLRTGEVEERFDESFDELHALRALARSEEKQDAYRFPEPIAEEWLAGSGSYLLQLATQGETLAGEVDFLEEKGITILGFHLRAGDETDGVRYRNVLRVIDTARRKLLYSETLVKDARALIPDSFFVRPPFVYFLKEHKTLIALNVWKS